MKIIYSILLLAFCAIVNFANAQQNTDAIPEHKTFTLQSEKVGELRTINVWTPPEYKTGTAALPVLYMPDGGVEEDFPHVANTLDQLIKAKKIEPIILVGIENTQRRKDLTGPTDIEKDKEIAPVVGGAQQFREFINDELVAQINMQYRTTNKKGIIGESLAGLFVTETFLLKPNMFDFYIAFDPSLWWNDKYLVKIAAEKLDNFPSGQKTFWFAGSSEKVIFKTVAQLAAIIKAKNITTLNWKYSPQKNEKHHTIFRSTKEQAIIWTMNNAK